MIDTILTGLEIVLIALYFVILYKERKRISKLIGLCGLIILLQILLSNLDTVTGVVLLLILDFYAETRDSLIAYVRKSSETENDNKKKGDKK